MYKMQIASGLCSLLNLLAWLSNEGLAGQERTIILVLMLQSKCFKLFNHIRKICTNLHTRHHSDETYNRILTDTALNILLQLRMEIAHLNNFLPIHIRNRRCCHTAGKDIKHNQTYSRDHLIQ